MLGASRLPPGWHVPHLTARSPLRGEGPCPGFPACPWDGKPFCPGSLHPHRRPGLGPGAPVSEMPGVSVCPTPAPAAVTSALWPLVLDPQHLLGGKLALCSQWPVVEKSHTHSRVNRDPGLPPWELPGEVAVQAGRRLRLGRDSPWSQESADTDPEAYGVAWGGQGFPKVTQRARARARARARTRAKGSTQAPGSRAPPPAPSQRSR